MLLEFFGLVIEFVSAFFSSSNFEALTLAVLGETLAVYSTVNVAIDKSSIFENSPEAVPFVLATMGAGDAVGFAAVIVEAYNA
jgi:hypothetical protein